MKKYFIITLAALFALVSCDILDKTPDSKISPDSYFKTEADLQLFTNPLYDLFSDTFFEQQSDHLVRLHLSDELRGGNKRQVPNSGSGWSWGTLRRINALLEYSSNCDDEAAVAKYNGLAKFFRAYFYFEKVKRFGDVPWIDHELFSDSPELYASRDSRDLVMGHMIEDIDEAIATLDDKRSVYRVNKYAALCLKAQFCLYEASWRKYHGEISGAQRTSSDFYALAAEAAKQVMDCGLYSLASNYQMLFAEEDADQNEFILAMKQDLSLSLTNNTTAFCQMPTQGCPGLTKKFVDSFLMKDGTRFTDKEGWQTMTFMDEVADRDPRLGYCTVLPGHKWLGTTDVAAPDYTASITGFQMCKYAMDKTLPNVTRVDMSYNDLPLYRLAEQYLIYAEAKAELGTLTQEDLDISVNLLRDRVGMPHMDMAAANANPDPYLQSLLYGYFNVKDEANKGVILELRRERSIELFQEGKRWDDLMRWKEGLCVNQPFHGPYFPGVGTYDLTGDKKADICIWTETNPKHKDMADFQLGSTDGIVLSGETEGCVDRCEDHIFDEERDYLYPIPINDRSLNHNLTQNPGWKDGLSF